MTAALTHPRRTARLLLLATVLIWGCSFSLVKGALADASPSVFNAIRMSLASVVLLALHWRSVRAKTWRELRPGLVAGVFLAMGYELQTLGLERTSPARSAFLTGLVVVFVPGLTLIPRLRPAGSARPGLPAALGAMAAFAGLVLLTSPPGAGLKDLFAGIDSGDVLTLGCAMAYAAHLLTLAHTAQKMDSGVLATVQIGMSAVLMGGVLPFVRSPHLNITPRLLMVLAFTSLFATAFAFSVQSFAQRHLPASQTAVLLTLEPVFAWLTALVFLGDRLSPRGLLGAALILGATLLIELAPATPLSEAPV